jgi:RNA polymerase sigma factor (sigma-70 family)
VLLLQQDRINQAARKPASPPSGHDVQSDPHRLDPLQLRAWLERAARRDAAAFQSLYEATASNLFGFALRILKKRELAEEALQDSFVAIWINAQSYQSHMSAPMTWMTAIVRNKALDVLRRIGDAEVEADQFSMEVINALQDPQATPIEMLQMSSEAKALAYCMSMLEAMQRQVVGLAYYQDMSHSEVAQHLDLPIGTVKTWVRRSLERLKKCLTKQEQT